MNSQPGSHRTWGQLGNLSDYKLQLPPTLLPTQRMIYQLAAV